MAKLELSLILPPKTDTMKINLAHLRDKLCVKFGLNPESVHLEANASGIYYSDTPTRLPIKIPANIGLKVYSSEECVDVMDETTKLTTSTLLAFLKAELGIQDNK